MSVGPAVVERLRAYLGDLPASARSSLLVEIERGPGLDRDGIDYGELVAVELRRSLRDRDTSPARLAAAARLFFQPLEPFLMDGGSGPQGRVARTTLEKMWGWLSSRIMPEEAAAFAAEVEKALQANEIPKAQALARAFQDAALQRMRATLQAAQNDDRFERRLGVQVGTPHAIAQMKAVVEVFQARDDIADLGGKLEAHIPALSGDQLDAVKALLDAQNEARSDLFRYGLLMVVGRLSAPWQLVRLSTRAAGTDSPDKVSATPYAAAVDIVLEELERMIAELAADLRHGNTALVPGLLRNIHDAVRGLRSELDLAPDSRWGKQLAVTRANISSVLTSEIDLVCGRVRRLLRLRQTEEITGSRTLDPDDVDEVAGLIEFLCACRAYASELAINDVTQRAYGELQQQLDIGTRALLDATRSASEHERPFRQSQVDVAVRFCSRIFGHDYAQLLVRASDIAGVSTARRIAQA